VGVRSAWSVFVEEFCDVDFAVGCDDGGAGPVSRAAVATTTAAAYLHSEDDCTYDIELEVQLAPAGGGEPQPIVRSNFRHLYWSMAQQLAHHAATGCNMRTGDLLASGTISGPEKSSRGCLLELTWRGEEPVELRGGGKRTFLEDGDRVTMTGYAQGDGYRVGFGEVTGSLLPAVI